MEMRSSNDDYLTLKDILCTFRKNVFKILTFTSIGLIVGLAINYSTKKFYRTESIVDYPVKTLERESFKKNYSDSLMMTMNDRKSASIMANQLSEAFLVNNEKELIAITAQELGTKIFSNQTDPSARKEFENRLTNYFYTYNYRGSANHSESNWNEKFNISIRPSDNSFDTNIVFTVNLPQRQLGAKFISYIFIALNKTAAMLKETGAAEKSYSYYRQNSPITEAILSINKTDESKESEFRKVVDLISRYHEIIRLLGISNTGLFEEFTRSYQSRNSNSTYSDEAYLDYLDGKIADRIAVKKIENESSPQSEEYIRTVQSLLSEKKTIFTLNHLKDSAMEETSKIIAVNYAEFSSKKRDLPHISIEELANITPVTIKADEKTGIGFFVLPIGGAIGALLGITYAFLASQLRKEDKSN